MHCNVDLTLCTLKTLDFCALYQALLEMSGISLDWGKQYKTKEIRKKYMYAFHT